MVSVGITKLFVLVLFNHVDIMFTFNLNNFLLRNIVIYSSIPKSLSTFLPTVEACYLYRPIRCPCFTTCSHKRVKRQHVINRDIVNTDPGILLLKTSARPIVNEIKSSAQPNVIDNLNGEKIKQISNASAGERRVRSNLNPLLTGSRKRTLNGALRKKKKMLQYINNPLIYSLRSTKQLTTLTTKSVVYPITKITSSPIFITSPNYNNDATGITLTPVPVQRLENQTWYSNLYNNYEVMARFMQSLDHFERELYKVTFRKLSSINSMVRRENGISFVQSGLFLQLALLALSSGVSREAGQEIEDSIKLKLTDMEKIYVLKAMVSLFPKSNDALKFRFSSRLVLGGQVLNPLFQHKVATALQMNVDRLNTNVTPEELTLRLNNMIENDSGGAMRDTFEEDELSEGFCVVLLQTMYFRPRWRSSPTVLNGTHPFLDGDEPPTRFTRMIRINDIMRYAELSEWDAEAIEIFYATPGLSLLIVVPRGRSLHELSAHLAETSIHRVLEAMYSLRVAVSLPLYTLRMTLLLPGKLESMNITRLFDIGNERCDDLRLSHAVQRLMFWSEAGRNAFKDDGIEWDDVPEHEIVVNRPYIFFVRWRNITIMNGNFVL